MIGASLLVAVILLSAGPSLVKTSYFLPEVPKPLTLEAAGLEGLAEANNTAPRHHEPLSNSSLRWPPVVDPNLAQLQYEAGLAFTNIGETDRALRYLEAAVESKPSNLRYGNDYRQSSIHLKEYERSVTFWERLAGQINSTEVHLQLALAYVDLMATRPGIIGQGQLSIQSIGELDRVLEARPYDWTARYARGLNNLYWPTGMMRLPSAIEDLSMALAIQQALPSPPAAFYVLSYIALGDAYAKNSQFDLANRVWQGGLVEFPGNTELMKRLDLNNEQLASFIEKERGLGIFISTDLSVLWNGTSASDVIQNGRS